MTTVTLTTEQHSSIQSLTRCFLETSFDIDILILDEIELDDLESIMTTEFAHGLPSDTEFSFF